MSALSFPTATGRRGPRSAIESLFVALALCLVSGAPTRSDDDPPSIPLDQDWQYRWGDSPIDARGVPIWTYEGNADGEWASLDVSRSLPAGDGETIWCRTELPAGTWRDPALFLWVVLPFEAYIDDRLICRVGEQGPSRRNKFVDLEWHIVPIPRDAPGRILALRVYWGKHHYFSPRIRLEIGSESALTRNAIAGGLDQLILGSLLVIIGMFGLYTFFRRQEKIACSFGLLAVCVGMYTMSGADTRESLPDAPVFWWYVLYLGLFFFPVGLWRFFELVFAERAAWIFRRLWQLHLVYAAGCLALDLLGVMPFFAGVRILLLLLVVGMISLTVTIARTASIAGTEVKILSAGAGFLLLFGLHDILQGFQLLPWRFYVFHWGIFSFILFLAFLLERRFADAHRRLHSQSESLRVSTEKLAEYSRTLERRVADRTRDLSEKNVQLEAALRDLREAQNQLIMREKMASLGALVAGVAHEVNSPIGAVNSAADVSSRCIGRMLAALDESPLRETMLANLPFQQAVTMLRDNTRLIANAGARIATIVRSLRSFARLDEADLQSADLHEGLDSTLTLVHHELKNRAKVVKEYGDLPLVECYPNQLNQVFMNLLVNAAHAIEDGGTIRITTWTRGGEAHVAIADTGKGIAPEHIGRIFDPGFTTKGVSVGVGLGLSISYSIIQKHNGTIEVKSEPGKGATFTVSLPIRRAPAENDE